MVAVVAAAASMGAVVAVIMVDCILIVLDESCFRESDGFVFGDSVALPKCVRFGESRC